MTTPDALEGQLTLRAAVARFDQLRSLDAPGETTDAGDDPPAPEATLSRDEALELLALGELIARKAAYGRQLDVRSARAAGASWAQIGAALGTSKQAAWELHNRWIDDQAAHHRHSGYEGFDEHDAATARAAAGQPAT